NLITKLRKEALQCVAVSTSTPTGGSSSTSSESAKPAVETSVKTAEATAPTQQQTIHNTNTTTSTNVNNAPLPQQQNFPLMMMYPPQWHPGIMGGGMYYPGMAGMPAAPPPGMFQGYLSYLDRQGLRRLRRKGERTTEV
ncbi:hypothetical protein ACHAWC_000253, partial [Mediolabrus comicus]